MKLTAAPDKTMLAIRRMDYSPINFAESNKQVARRVNAMIGMNDGGNVNIALGNVLYPSDQDARRQRVLEKDEAFYAG